MIKMNEEIKYILESLSFKASIYRDKSKRNLTYNDDEYYSNILYEYITELENNWNELKKWLEETKKDIDKARKLHEEYSLSEERLSSKYFAYSNVLNKMQEMEQGKDE